MEPFFKPEEEIEERNDSRDESGDDQSCANDRVPLVAEVAVVACQDGGTFRQGYLGIFSIDQ